MHRNKEKDPKIHQPRQPPNHPVQEVSQLFLPHPLVCFPLPARRLPPNEWTSIAFDKAILMKRAEPELASTARRVVRPTGQTLLPRSRVRGLLALSLLLD